MQQWVTEAARVLQPGGETAVTAPALDCAVPEVGLAEVRARPCGGMAAPPGHARTSHLPV